MTKFRTEAEAIAWAVMFSGFAGVDAHQNGRIERAAMHADEALEHFRSRVPRKGDPLPELPPATLELPPAPAAG